MDGGRKPLAVSDLPLAISRKLKERRGLVFRDPCCEEGTGLNAERQKKGLSSEEAKKRLKRILGSKT